MTFRHGRLDGRGPGFGVPGVDRDAHPVRSFPTFTQDLKELADWLDGRGIRTVAMEEVDPILWTGVRHS